MVPRHNACPINLPFAAEALWSGWPIAAACVGSITAEADGRPEEDQLSGEWAGQSRGGVSENKPRRVLRCTIVQL